MNATVASETGREAVEGKNIPDLPSFILQSLTLASHSVNTRESQKAKGLINVVHITGWKSRGRDS